MSLRIAYNPPLPQTTRASKRFAYGIALLSTALLSCGGQNDGLLSVTAYGESFIEDGIPAAEVSDGWAVRFERFTVHLRDVVVAATPLEVTESIDLTPASDGQGHAVGSTTVPTGQYGNAQFTIERVDVTGSAEKADQTKNFSWVFEQATRYEQCETVTRVGTEDAATFQITVHADHLLFDSLVAEEPALVFEPLANADSNSDGSITRSELEAAGIGALDPGNRDDIDNLWAWLEAQVSNLGHVDGEGHCTASIAESA